MAVAVQLDGISLGALRRFDWQFLERPGQSSMLRGLFFASLAVDALPSWFGPRCAVAIRPNAVLQGAQDAHV